MVVRQIGFARWICAPFALSGALAEGGRGLLAISRALQEARSCIGSEEQAALGIVRPNEVSEGRLTNECGLLYRAGVNGSWVGRTCTEQCSDDLVNEVYQEEFEYRCEAEEVNNMGHRTCTCFQRVDSGPDPPLCDIGHTCTLDHVQHPELDHSDCDAAAELYPQRRDCEVRCADSSIALAGDSSATLTCPAHNSAVSLRWQGDPPTCSACDFVERPAVADVALQDTCLGIGVGDMCEARCEAEAFAGAGSRNFECKRTSADGVCNCFQFSGSDSTSLICEEQDSPSNMCVAPVRDDGAIAMYDITDCTDHRRTGSCSVTCAPGFHQSMQDYQTHFTCVGSESMEPLTIPSRYADHGCLDSNNWPDNATYPNCPGVRDRDFYWPACRPISCGLPLSLFPAITVNSTQEVLALGRAMYLCPENTVVQENEGLEGGIDHFFIPCETHGAFRLPVNFHPCQLLSSGVCRVSMRPTHVFEQAHLVDECADVRGGDLCIVRCAEGFMDSGITRATRASATHAQLQCTRYDSDLGRCTCFAGLIPQCVPDSSYTPATTTTTTTTFENPQFRRRRTTTPRPSSGGRDCGPPPQLPRAIASRPAQAVRHRESASYACQQGSTSDGTPNGAINLELMCTQGYFRQSETTGCAPVIVNTCQMNSSMLVVSLDTTACTGTISGSSCPVHCARDWYQILPDRYSGPLPDRKESPVIMECHHGFFYGSLPVCIQDSRRTEFDVYALMKRNDISTTRLNYPDPAFATGPYSFPVPTDEHLNTLPSNLNVFDLEGLLATMYQVMFKNSDAYAMDETVFIDKRRSLSRNGADPHEIRSWNNSHPRVGHSHAIRWPLHRDIADTAVWYRLKVRNSDRVPLPQQVANEFTTFANFESQKAMNPDSTSLYNNVGEAVGLRQTVPGVDVVWRQKGRERDENGRPTGELVEPSGPPPADPGTNALDALCRDANHWDQLELRLASCDRVEQARGAQTYVPSGRYLEFSMPGICPNLAASEMNSDDVPKIDESGGWNPACVMPDPLKLTGDNPPLFDGIKPTGGCPVDSEAYLKGWPTGERGCTYVLKEIARVDLGDITGTSTQPCHGSSGSSQGSSFTRRCHDLLDFQYSCSNDTLRQGTRWCEKNEDPSTDCSATGQQCTEYGVRPRVEHNRTLGAQKLQSCYCLNVTGDEIEIECQNAWRCDNGCDIEKMEVGLPIMRGRCDAKKNAQRLLKMKSLFVAAAERAGTAPPPIEMVQNCGNLEACSRPDQNIGLSYCERDGSGVCSPCFVPNTTHFDTRRAEGQSECRSDLFAAGGYPEKLPNCHPPGPNPTNQSCCAFLNNCGRQWVVPEQNWTDCSTRCGTGVKMKDAVCPMTSDFGDCRNDRAVSGRQRPVLPGEFCDDGTCYSTEACLGEECPWQPWCGGTNIDDADFDDNGGTVARSLRAISSSDIESDVCVPVHWGAVDSECGWGVARRGRRCSFFDPGASDGGASFCSDSPYPEPQTERHGLFRGKSKWRSCGVCAPTSSRCDQCADGYRSGPDHQSCVPSTPMVEFEVSVQVPRWAVHALERTSSSDLQGLVRDSNPLNAEAEPASDMDAEWFFETLYVLDAYRTPPDADADADATGEVAAGTLLSLGSRRLQDSESWTVAVGMHRSDGRNATDELNTGLPVFTRRFGANLLTSLRREAGGNTGPPRDLGPELVGEVILVCPEQPQEAMSASDPCPSEVVPPGLPWPLIGGGLAGVLVLGAIVYLCQSRAAAATAAAGKKKQNEGIELGNSNGKKR